MQNTVERKKRSKSAVLTDTLVFVSVLAIFIATLLSIAREVTMLGGKITYGENINLLNFFVGDKGIIGAISNVTENFDSASEEAVLGAFGIIRMFVVLVAAVMHFIIIFIKTICAIVRFAKKDSVKVARTGLSVLSGTIRYFLMLSLFATLSGGMDSGAYAIGYTGGMPLTIALGVLFFAILLMAILRYKENKDKVDKTIDGGKRFTGAIFGALCGAGILVVLNYTYLYGIISGTMFSFITLMAGMVQGGLDILSLLYPILNIVIIVAVMILMKKASGNMKRSLRYALEYGEQVELKTKKPKEYIIKGYVLAIVFSLIAILSVYVLRIPTVGSGWEANVFVQLVAMFILSCVGQTFVSVFTGKKPKSSYPEIAVLCFCLLALAFMVFTFLTPELGIFKDPVSGTYGIY